MIVEKKQGPSQTMTFLVGVNLCYLCFCLENDPQTSELEIKYVFVCIMLQHLN